MIGGNFAPLTIMNNEDTDMDAMIISFNTAVTETASKTPGKHRQKEIFEPEGTKKYNEVKNNKMCMKRQKKA